MPKIYEHAKNIPEAEERGRTFILDTAQKLSRLMLVSATWPGFSVVHVQLWF